MEATVKLDQPEKHVELFGPADCHLRFLGKSLLVRISAHQGCVRVVGARDQVERTVAVLNAMQRHLLTRDILTAADVEAITHGQLQPINKTRVTHSVELQSNAVYVIRTYGGVGGNLSDEVPYPAR